MISQVTASFFAKQFVNQVFHESYTTFEDMLDAFIKNRFEFAQSNLPLIKILLQEMAFHSEIQTAFKREFTEKVYPVLSRAIDFYKRKGDIRDLPNETIIRITVSSIIGFMITRFLLEPDKKWDDETEITQTIGVIMNGIGNGRNRVAD